MPLQSTFDGYGWMDGYGGTCANDVCEATVSRAHWMDLWGIPSQRRSRYESAIRSLEEKRLGNMEETRKKLLYTEER